VIPGAPTEITVAGVTLRRCETPEPWATAKRLIDQGRTAEANALIEREVPEDAEVPETRNVMFVIVAIEAWKQRCTTPHAWDGGTCARCGARDTQHDLASLPCNPETP